MQALGFSRTIGSYVIFTTPWRLTLNGQNFAANLAKPEALSVIKDKFKEEGLSVVVDVVADIAKQYANKKLENIFN